MPSCPGQDNFTDCGVFCLHYMKSLYQYTDEMMDTLYVSTCMYIKTKVFNIILYRLIQLIMMLGIKIILYLVFEHI
jgi:Ulp1 family protease